MTKELNKNSENKDSNPSHYECPFCDFKCKYWGLNGEKCDFGLNYHIYMSHEGEIHK